LSLARDFVVLVVVGIVLWLLLWVLKSAIQLVLAIFGAPRRIYCWLKMEYSRSRFWFWPRTYSLRSDKPLQSVKNDLKVYWDKPSAWWKEWVLPFLGYARLVTPEKLNDFSEPSLFANQLIAAMEDIRRGLSDAGGQWIAGPISLLALPSSAANDVIGNIPDFKGVNLGKLFAWIRSVFGYFSWRVEPAETYEECKEDRQNNTAGKTKGDGSGDDAKESASIKGGTSGTVRVFANLRWGWHTRQNWSFTVPSASKTDLVEAAHHLAVLILSERYNNRRLKRKGELVDGQNFELFIKGVAALGRYDELSESVRPSQSGMNTYLAEAAEKLQSCVNLYPRYELGLFYRAVVNVLQHQNEYVVPDLARSLQGLEDEPTLVPSRYLESAVKMFGEIGQKAHSQLFLLAKYNYAKALVKRECDGDLKRAAILLDKLAAKLDNLIKDLTGETRHKGPRTRLREEEARALRLQTKCLSTYVKVRRALPIRARSPYSAQQYCQECPLMYLLNKEWIRESDFSKLTPEQKLDLQADALNSTAYLCYELARLERKNTKSALACKAQNDWLSKAQELLDEACALKPRWAPLQTNKLRITIERMRRLRADAVCAGNSNEKIEDRRAEAKNLLASIQGQ